MRPDFTKRLQFKGKDLERIRNKISKLDEFRGFWKGSLNISPQILYRLKKSIIITSAGASTRIEGAGLTDAEVKMLLSGFKIQKLKDRDSQEVAGYAEVIKIIFDEYKNIQLTENTVKHLHHIQMKYAEKDQYHKGQYKKGSNAVIARDKEGHESVIFSPTPPYLTEKEMSELIVWTNAAFKEKLFHPILIIGNFVCEFLAIHPFQDGNGRLSRNLTNLLLLQHGLTYTQYASLEKIIEDNKLDYYMALRKSQKNRDKKRENLAPWMNFFLDCLIKQTKVARTILLRENREDELSENQRNILNFLKNSRKPQSVSQVTESVHLNRETAKKALQRLHELQLVQMLGLGRGTKWKI